MSRESFAAIIVILLIEVIRETSAFHEPTDQLALKVLQSTVNG